MLPHVVLHVEASLDGRIDQIQPDVGRFYRLAAGFHEDAILTGADTLLEGAELPAQDDPKPPAPDEIGGAGPLFIVTDSRCRFDRWNWLRRQPTGATLSPSSPRGARPTGSSGSPAGTSPRSSVASSAWTFARRSRLSSRSTTWARCASTVAARSAELS